MRVPVTTYRLQLHAGFGFRDIAAVLEYLARLGITDLYASPIFAAQPGSLHGYDIIDPNRLNPELGSAEAWETLTAERRRFGMGWLQDIVPNHMAFSGHNRLLADLFENGPHSVFYRFFDIRWDHPRPELKGRVLAPFLGDRLANCLERGEIVLEYQLPGLALTYFDHRFPLALESYTQVFEPMTAQDDATDRIPEIDVWRRGIQQLLLVAAAAPSQERSARINDAKHSLWELYKRSPRIESWVDQRIAALNRPEGRPCLERLLESQHYRLCFWQRAAGEINYRRFFSINGLIGLRQEEAAVFDDTHKLIREMVADGRVTGLRIDHVDGLSDPGSYLARLREVCADTFIVVEKILAPGEVVDPRWPVQGTTGYEFAAHLDALFTLPDHEEQMTAIYQELISGHTPFRKIGRQSKTEILHQQFEGDLANLGLRFEALARQADCAGLPTQEMLRAALAQILINLPVYRTYLASAVIRPADITVIEGAVETSRRQRPDLAPVLDCLKALLLHQGPEDKNDPVRMKKYRRAVSAFEQLAAALAAKGIEDTALYRYNRLSALNEVGGQPEHFDGSLTVFDRFAARRQPFTLNALSTHDTKRSADVRARMLVVAELPDEWHARVKQWRRLNAQHYSMPGDVRVPDPEMEYLLYQTLIGTFPEPDDLDETYTERIAAYMVKAAREAKQHTRWRDPRTDYETALQHFVRALLRPSPDNLFLADFMPFAARAAWLGRYTALSQCLVQLTAPGIPDIYQGSEIFDDSLVDPDNRRPVDFGRRRHLLEELMQERERDSRTLTSRLAAIGGDRLKLFITYAALQVRRRYSDLFLKGRYQPLVCEGRYGRHVVAFARVYAAQWCLTVVPRFLSNLVTNDQLPVGPAVWADTTLGLPPGAPQHWIECMTNSTISGRMPLAIADILADFPVALVFGEARA